MRFVYYSTTFKSNRSYPRGVSKKYKNKRPRLEEKKSLKMKEKKIPV